MDALDSEPSRRLRPEDSRPSPSELLRVRPASFIDLCHVNVQASPCPLLLSCHIGGSTTIAWCLIAALAAVVRYSTPKMQALSKMQALLLSGR